MIEDKEQLAHYLKRKILEFSTKHRYIPDKADILAWLDEYDTSHPRGYWKCDACGNKFITLGDAIMCCSDKRG